MFFDPKEITKNVLANPILSNYLKPTSTIPIKITNNIVESISNTIAYRQHPVASIQLQHIISKQTGNIL
jgi:hypothetical protein